ncbi:hypothetical protein D5S18_02595 [Nocardia panacis]|uniref:Uncharacterized protein n=1 Tax=Nocardia panacis TaxID=2340916 RepID=A0A3A4K343_9NOCA|nr:hypothetical protein D5S18_02595 [Nocardia panacis]
MFFVLCSLFFVLCSLFFVLCSLFFGEKFIVSHTVRHHDQWCAHLMQLPPVTRRHREIESLPQRLPP